MENVPTMREALDTYLTECSDLAPKQSDKRQRFPAAVGAPRPTPPSPWRALLVRQYLNGAGRGT